MHLLFEQGVLGFLAFSVVLALSLLRAFRRLEEAGEAALVGTASGVAGAAFGSLFNHSIEIPSVGLMVWGLVGASQATPTEGRAKGVLSRLTGAVLALFGLALLAPTLKVDLAHRLYDRAREWRLPPLEACGALRRATELDPSLPVYWAALGEASFRAGLGPREFLPPLREAVRRAPFDPWLRRLYYWGLYRAGRAREAALEALWTAERLSPASGLFRCDAAWLLYNSGRKGEALRLLRRPLHLRHKAAAEWLLSALLEGEGKEEETAEARRRALHFLRFYRLPGSPFTAPYLRLPFEESLPAFRLPGPDRIIR